MSNTVYEVHVRFEWPLAVSKNELQVYLNQNTGTRHLETDAKNVFLQVEEADELARYVITYDDEADAIPDMDALKRMMDNTPTPIETMEALVTDLDTGDMTPAPIPGGTFLNFI